MLHASSSDSHRDAEYTCSVKIVFIRFLLWENSFYFSDAHRHIFADGIFSHTFSENSTKPRSDGRDTVQ